jgi:uncharacterized protein YecE (DUF72 family)
MIHVGTMGWSYNFWKGNFYPEELKPQQFLGYYARQFDTVEINSTFYSIPQAQTVEEWKKQTPARFIFSLKFPRAITHVKMLKDCHKETQIFLDRAELLGDKLGPLLLQFPAAFSTKQLPLLKSFLEELPRNNRYAVEIRNKDLLNEPLYSILRENNIAPVWVESPFLPTTDKKTSDFLYIRWEGDRRKVSGALGKKEADKGAELRQWADKLERFSSSNQDIYGYFSKYFSGYPPADVRELTTLLKK